MPTKPREKVYLDFKDESDRAVAVLSAAFLDHELEVLLRRFLRAVKATDSLFDPMQPLSSFSSRTKFSYVLGLIDSRSYRDLNRVRKVRNSFAHDRTPRTFDEAGIAKIVTELEFPKLLDEYRRPKTSRATFEVATQMLLGAISSLKESAHSQKRVSIDEQDIHPETPLSHHDVELSTAIFEDDSGTTASLSISYATQSPIRITWDNPVPVTELIRQLSVVEHALSTPTPHQKSRDRSTRDRRRAQPKHSK